MIGSDRPRTVSLRERVARAALPLGLLSIIPATTAAQTDPATCVARLSGADFVGPSADVARVLDVLRSESRNSFLLRRISDRMSLDACASPGAIENMARHLSLPPLPARGVSVLPVDARVTYNGGYPRDWNEGVLWAGAGLSSSLTAGAAFRWNMLEAALAPILAFQNNAAFQIVPYPETSSYSRYSNRWHVGFIDLPQRFGNDGSRRIDPGQSYLRVNTGGVRAGVSHENLAWGPARRNPLLLSGTAPGFPHAFIESSRPLDVWLGGAEFQVFWGRLSESEYFDLDRDNDHRALSGTLATLRPKGLDGLYLGAAQLHMQTWSSTTSAGDVILGPFTGIDPDASGLPRAVRLVAVFARWAAAPGGFDVYGEWARQDSWKQWLRLLNPVDASHAYTIGLQKIVRRGDHAVRLSAEVSHLSDALAHRDLGRGMQTLYVSRHVPQGHTHRGQLLGAPIGPGSEAQFIGADLFWRYGRTSLSVERARYDDDAYYAVWGQIHGPHGHDTEMSFRAGHILTRPEFSIEGEVGYSFRYNRTFIGLHHSNHPGFPYLRDENISIRVSGRWNPPELSWQP